MTTIRGEIVFCLCLYMGFTTESKNIRDASVIVWQWKYKFGVFLMLMCCMTEGKSNVV